MTSQENLSRLLDRCGLSGTIKLKNGCLPELPENLGEHFHFTMDDSRLSGNYFKTTPKDLNHLKQLAGVPSETIENAVNEGKDHRLLSVSHHELPTEKEFKLNALPSPSQQAVLDASHNLLFGHVDTGLIKAMPYSAVVNYMLSEAKDLTVFAAQNLIVKNGETRTFKDAATLVFGKVEIHGTGQIVIESQIKLVADSIQYLAS